MDDLFAAAAEERSVSSGPLAARMRPRTLDEVAGQRHLVAPGAPFRRLVEADRLASVILHGPPGTGKTTLAELVAVHTSREFHRLSATSSGVKEVRDVIARADDAWRMRAVGTVLFLDEIHRFSKSQQDALLPSVEAGLITLVGATTENPYHALNPALRSRSTLFRVEPLADDDIVVLLDRALGVLGCAAERAAVELVAARCGGDARQALVSLEVAATLAEAEGTAVSLAHAEAALGASALRYGRDEHYDVVSAFVKSIRGSDPDAALHWLARMLEAGEDPRFIARRLVILASEDVGMARSAALGVAVAAAQALELVGLPEAALNLAHATVYLARSEKSNSVTTALAGALADVRDGRIGEVPLHLRDTHYAGAAKLGHTGYVSPHDDPTAHQAYLPDELAGRRYLP